MAKAGSHLAAGGDELERDIPAENEAASADMYKKYRAEIDTALRQCTSHLKKLPTLVALETIRRLRDHYYKHGNPGKVGEKA